MRVLYGSYAILVIRWVDMESAEIYIYIYGNGLEG